MAVPCTNINKLITDAAFAHTAILEQEISAIVRHKRVQLKQFYVPYIRTSFNLKKVCTDNLPDLVVIGLVAETDFFSHLY